MPPTIVININVGIILRLNLLQNSSTDDIYYLQNLYPSPNASAGQGFTDHKRPVLGLSLLIPIKENALCVFEENFHPLSMIFNENEAWIPDEGNDVILTSPPVLKIVKSKTEDLDEDEGIDGEMIEEFEDALET